MKHARNDYQRIQDPALQDRNLLAPGCTAIGEDEPVFLLRAKDRLFMKMLEHYHELLQNYYPESVYIQQSVSDHMELTDEWQQVHDTKMPDLPK